MYRRAAAAGLVALALGCGLRGTPPQRKSAAPVGALRAEGRDGAIRISWNGNPKAAPERVPAFDVLRREEREGAPPDWFVKIGSVDADTYRRYELYDRAVEPGKTYRYRVRPRLREAVPAAEIKYTGPEETFTWGAPPPAPAGLKAIALNHSARLTWTAVEGASGYRVYEVDEATGKPRPEPAQRGLVDSTAWIALGLTNGKSVRYVVRAVGHLDRQPAFGAQATPTPSDEPQSASAAEVQQAASQGIPIPSDPAAVRRAIGGLLGEGALPGIESVSSEAVSVTPGLTEPAPEPKRVDAVLVVGGVSVTWRPSPGVEIVGYHVERRRTALGADRKPVEPDFSRITKEPVTGKNEYTDHDVKRGEEYEYRVRAIDASGTLGRPSRPSKPVKITER